MRDRLDAHVPRLIVDPPRAARAYELRCLRDLVRERGGQQDLREQRVRVERDRRQEPFQLGRRRRRRRILRLCRGEGGRCDRTPKRDNAGQAQRERGTKGLSHGHDLPTWELSA